MKKQSTLLGIVNLQNHLLDVILIISSSFFMTLTFIAVIFPSIVNRPISLLAGWLILIFLSSNKFVPANKKIAVARIINTIGSLSFLFFFVSSWINPSGLLARIYEIYSITLQQTFNQFFIETLLFIIAIFIFINLFMLILKGLGYLFDKFSVNQKVRVVIVATIVIAWSCIMIITSTIIKSSNSGISEILPYFIPFFGLSLLFLHVNFLIKRIRKIFTKTDLLSN